MRLVSTQQIGTHNIFLEIARGNVDGASVVHKFGRNPDVDSAAAEDIWDASNTYTWPVSACAVTIESSSSSDSAGSGGARTLQLFGLDANFSEASEVVSLAGRNQVTSASSYRRLHRMVVLSAGSIQESAGNIEAVHGDTGSTLASITQGFNQTLMAVYTIPASRTGYLTNWNASIDRAGIAQNRSGDVKLQVRPEGEVFQTKSTVGLFNDSRERFYSVPLKISAKSDIKVNASAVTNNTAFSAAFDLILLNNDVNF